MVALRTPSFGTEVFLRLLDMFGPPQRIECVVFSDLITNKLKELDPDFNVNSISYPIFNPTRERTERLIDEMDFLEKIKLEGLIEEQKHSLTHSFSEMAWFRKSKHAGIEVLDFQIRATPSEIKFYVSSATPEEIVTKAEDFWKSVGKYSVKISSG